MQLHIHRNIVIYLLAKMNMENKQFSSNYLIRKYAQNIRVDWIITHIEHASLIESPHF